MTRDELDEILHQCYSVEIFPEEAAELIWGQPFDGETERIKPATEESSATPTIGNEADFATKSMTEDEIMAGKMAKDLHQIREQIYALGKYQTNLLGESGYMLVRMFADAERLDSHLRRRWNTQTPNPHNQ